MSQPSYPPPEPTPTELTLRPNPYCDGPQGLLIDPLPRRWFVFKLAFFTLVVFVAFQFATWGLALVSPTWMQSGPQGVSARWAASQLFSGEKITGAVGLIAKLKNQAPTADTASGSLGLLAKAGDEEAATALCLMPIAHSVDEARSTCSTVLAYNPDSKSARSHLDSLEGAWQLKVTLYREQIPSLVWAGN